MLLQRLLCCAVGEGTGYRADKFEDDEAHAFRSRVAASATWGLSTNHTCDDKKVKYDGHSKGGVSVAESLTQGRRWEQEKSVDISDIEAHI